MTAPQADASRIAGEIDFDRDGRQAGTLRAPLSRNTSGWGIVEIPVIVVQNGSGPTVLLTGGVHGDEYEGPIALSELGRSLRPEQIQGRVIMMPAVNVPAVQRRHAAVAGRQPRHEPLLSRRSARHLQRDAGALPRRGDPADGRCLGRPAHRGPFRRFDPLDQHASRGRPGPDGSARWPPRRPSGRPTTSCSAASTKAPPSPRRSSGAGMLSLGTELGGWGTGQHRGTAHRAARRAQHPQAFRGDRRERRRPASATAAPAPATWWSASSTDYCLRAPRRNLRALQPGRRPVRAGDPAGYLHFVEDIDHPPAEVRYRSDGVLWMSAGPGRVARGDTVAVVMRGLQRWRRGLRCRKILILDCKQEISSFNPLPSAIREFPHQPRRRDAADHRGLNTEIGGALEVFDERAGHRADPDHRRPRRQRRAAVGRGLETALVRGARGRRGPGRQGRRGLCLDAWRHGGRGRTGPRRLPSDRDPADDRPRRSRWSCRWTCTASAPTGCCGRSTA